MFSEDNSNWISFWRNIGWINLHNKAGHQKYYPQDPQGWISWYDGSSENRVIQRTLRSDAKICDPTLIATKVGNQTVYETVYRMKVPSKCLCHNEHYVNRQPRLIYNGISPKAKNSWRWIINQLDLVQSTKKRVNNRMYRSSPRRRGPYGCDDDSTYHKKRNEKIKLIVLTAYSEGEPHCSCPYCNVTTLDWLCLDHKKDDGGKRRKSLKKRGKTFNYGMLLRVYKDTGIWPKGLQVLCHNCNWTKRMRGQCSPEFHDKSLKNPNLVTIFN